MGQHKGKTNSSKVESPVKRKSKFTNGSSRESDKKRKKFMCDNFGEDEIQKRWQTMRQMRDNLKEEKKNFQKKRITKEKK